MDITPTLLTDGYKIDHRRQYTHTRGVYAGMTPRKSRISDINKVVVFGMQYYNSSTLIEKWNRDFFQKDINEITEEFLEEMTEYTLSQEAAKAIGVDHWKMLHSLGYLPLEIKALPEGTRCPIRVPMYTIRETHPDFYWLVNYIETDMSAEIWGMVTAATIADQYRRIFDTWAKETGGDLGFIPFQGHNFSYRGCFGREAAFLIDMAHLTSFVGSDTIPGRKLLKKYYKAQQKDFGSIISCSVFATEHAVMCTGTGFYIRKNQLTWEKYGEAEFEVFKRLITELYPNGIVSIVSDTWDLWKVLTDYLPRLKKEILARDGKVVIRPDSGNPVDIICGHREFLVEDGKYYSLDNRFMKDYQLEDKDIPACKGVVQLLWETFGGTTNDRGYKVLDSHIGCIYGDSITLQYAAEICQRLTVKGYCSTNWVAGIGSYTYQYVTRDTFGMAQKTTHATIEIDGESIDIDVFKDPITDDGTKKSARGLMQVFRDEEGNIRMKDQCTWEEEKQGLLRTIFKDSVLYNETSLEEIRKTIRS